MPRSGSLADVLPAVLRLLGAPSPGDATEPDPLGLGEQIGELRQAAVLLVDGFGAGLLARADRAASLFADIAAGRTGLALELTAPFPSTTPTSLVTLGTGSSPGVHGVLGFTVRNPATDRVLVHVAWRGTPSPRDWQPVPRLLETAPALGVSTAVVADPAFAGTPLTDAAYGTARHVGVRPGLRTATAMVRELRAGTRLVYGYHAALDTAGHRHGIESRQWRSAARDVARLVERVVDGLPDGAALFVTADHGMLDVPAADRLDIGTDAELASGVRLVAGEPRVRYLHTEAGATDDVRSTWAERLDGRATVHLRDELVDGGWFGPVPPAHLGRIGDVVVVCRAPFAVMSSRTEPAGLLDLVGFHGSVTDVERAVPLIALRR